MDEKNIIEYVASLARVELTEEEREVIAGQFSHILEYIDKLKKVDLEGVEIMRAIHESKNVFRQDQVVNKNCQEDILSNAPVREGNYFKIPKVLE